MASYNNNNTNDGNSRTMSLLRSKLAANSNLANNLSSTAKGATLASIYQAKKSGKFEDTKVEVLKQQFQNQIERRTTTTSTSHEPTSKILNRSHIPSRHEREVSEFRKLEREKSFDEARNAVQNQIEKIFLKSQQHKGGGGGANNIVPPKKVGGIGHSRNVPPPMMAMATNNARLSRRDQEIRNKDGSGIQSSAQDMQTRKRVPSLEPKVPYMLSEKQRSLSMVISRNAEWRENSKSTPAVTANGSTNKKSFENHQHHSSSPRRNNLNVRHNSFDNLTPVKPSMSRTPNARYQSNRRARELEQHLKDKYGLPDSAVVDNGKTLRRANSHSSLSQFSPTNLIRPSATTSPAVNQTQHSSRTLIRRKSTGLEPIAATKSSVKNLTDLMGSGSAAVGHRETRDSKLRYLGRMSPEEQVDKYLKSVEKEARFRQKLRQKAEALESHTDYRTTFDPSRHLPQDPKRVNTAISSRWHSLDSVSRPVLVKGVKNNIMNRNNRKSQSPTDHGKKPLTRLVNPRGKSKPEPEMAVHQHRHHGRERTDLTKSFVSMPQIGSEHFPSSGASSVSTDLRKSPEEKMSTGSDNNNNNHPHQNTGTVKTPIHNNYDDEYQDQEEELEDEFVDSCSCTDVTLDETLKINHNHRKSMARKKKLQTQRLRELQKVEKTTNNNSHSAQTGTGNRNPSQNGTGNRNNDNNNTNNHAIRVSYLGSITLDSKSNDLLALQKPLKSLYFKHVIAQQAGLDPVQGNLQITKTGLKMQYSRRGTIQEVFSTFASIAVWAAVRFVLKSSNSNSNHHQQNSRNMANSENHSGNFYAFLPLITDPGDEARNRLFCPLSKSELKYTKRSTIEPQHPPMFACITRTADKNLECHGFVCKSTEEAVSIAAQLYQALVDTVKAQGNDKKFRLTRSSSISMGSVTSIEDLKESNSNPTPVRPMRNKKKISNSSGNSSPSKMSMSSSDNHLSSSSSKLNKKSEEKSSNDSATNSFGNKKGMRKKKRDVNQWKKSEDDSSSSSYDTDPNETMMDDCGKVPYEKDSKIIASNGDIYTKVAMPRSKSFMKINHNHNGNQYNLQDLFKELKDQHGIASIDDLLRHVIRPEGMSFNKIEPVYRELLLKLAMSMSKDEIFIRSKTIMDQEKDKKKALLLMGGSKLLNNKNLPKDSSGRLIIQKENSDVEPEPIIKDKSLSNQLKKTFLMKRKNSTRNGKVGVTVGSKTASGSISKRSKRYNSSRRKRSNAHKNTATTITTSENNHNSKSKDHSEIPDNNENETAKKPLTKFDIGLPMPLVEGARDEISKKWMLTDIKDIKADLDHDAKISGPDSGITSGGQTMKSSTIKADDQKSDAHSCSQCGYVSDNQDDKNNAGGPRSTCSCSIFGTVTPATRSAKSRVQPSSACSTCYCQICGEDSATNTCYSCSSSMYSGGSVLERKSSIKSISRIGDRTLALIDTDSESSLESFGSIDSPKTAWKNANRTTGSGRTVNSNKSNEIKEKARNISQLDPIEDNDDEDDEISSVITDSSVASVIEAVKKATESNGGRGEVIDGYYRNPAASTNPSTIYGFTLKRKNDLMPGSPSLLTSQRPSDTTKARPSFRQYNATVTSRHSQLSMDSLASPLSSLTLIGQNSSGNGNNTDNNIDSAVGTFRNRGPRPAYSDANMQHSLGYLP